MTLAIELAAARLRTREPGDLAALLGERLAGLRSDAADLPDRHRSLPATVAWSTDQLAPVERLVLGTVALFPGGARPAAVRAVLDTTVEPSAIARRRLAGVVEAVGKDRIVLGTADGRVEVPASQAWLESRRDNFLAVVEAVAGASAKSISDALEYQVFTVTGAEGWMARTQEIADGLTKLGPLTIANDIEATIGNPVKITGRLISAATRLTGSPIQG